MRSRSHVLLPLLMAAALASAGCTGVANTIEATVGNIFTRVDTAISDIDSDATRWMATLQALISDLQGQGFTSAASYVRDTVQNSIARVGIEYRCNVDFTTRRIRGSLVALRDALRALGRDTVPATQPVDPFVCAVTPDRVSWREATTSLSFAGFDLARGNLSAVVIAPDQQVRNITPSLTQSSPYQLVLNLSSTSAGFPMPCERIELRNAAGATVSQVSCIADCPPPPAPVVVPGDERVVLDRTFTCTDVMLTGCRLDVNVGNRCPNGYRRIEPFEITVAHSKGEGHCGEGDQNPGGTYTSNWQSPNPDDCAIHAHIGLRGGFQSTRTCRFIVRARRPEQIIPRPAPVVGWCR